MVIMKDAIILFLWKTVIIWLYIKSYGHREGRLPYGYDEGCESYGFYERL